MSAVELRRKADYWWVGALLALLINTGALFYWGGKITTRIEAIGEAVKDHETRLRLVEHRL